MNSSQNRISPLPPRFFLLPLKNSGHNTTEKHRQNLNVEGRRKTVNGPWDLRIHTVVDSLCFCCLLYILDRVLKKPPTRNSPTGVDKKTLQEQENFVLPSQRTRKRFSYHQITFSAIPTLLYPNTSEKNLILLHSFMEPSRELIFHLIISHCASSPPSPNGVSRLMESWSSNLH